MFYIYILRDPLKNNIPFYVGKGIGNRAYKHIKETKENTINRRKFNRIQKILKSGLVPIVDFIVTDITDEKIAYNIETQFIKFYGRKDYDQNGILDNVCLDANPPGFNNCQNQEEFKRKISESMMGEKNHFYGKTHSAESKKKIGQASKGRVVSKEIREQISKSLKGKQKPQGFGEKLSKSRTGMKYKKNPNRPKRTLSDAHKKAISDSRKGQKLTDEHRKKISKSVKKAHIKKPNWRESSNII